MKGKFKNFLLEVDSSEYKMSRSEEVDSKKVVELLNSDYSEAFKQFKDGNKIFRGTSSDWDYMVTDPSIGTRVSANTLNYYTLIIDNCDAWKEYPKRSKSIICTTTTDYASGYGRIYAVFPINGSNIGVCSKEDFWESFPVLKTEYRRAGIPIDPVLGSLTRLLGGLVDLVGKRPDVKTLPSLKKAFDAVDTFITNKEYDQKSNLNTGILFDVMKMLDYKGHLYTSVEDLLNPVKNKFQMEKIGSFKAGKNNEVWTDGKCLLIDVDYIKKIMSKMDK
jgi:hypothetical protein